MNLKKIESLLSQIENAALVTVDDSPLLSSCNILSDPIGDENNNILELEWEADGLVFSTLFNEKNFDDATVSDESIILLNSLGEKSEIHLFDLEKSPVVTDWD
jgi:hypothetical protein